eukprot:TRINITY_DN658_c0_g1_i2.p3 TRINITY_DN658_c0_g1~~TRINITY_DN658_c0_g1_i2.p3  ORF type:complete len:157 (-),score=41.95 TRINITY_DN658_c0_g1_i2:1409-1879(-)
MSSMPENRGAQYITTTGKEEAHVVTLDSVLPTFNQLRAAKRVAVVKADVEGYEARVFKGGQLFLQHHQPRAIFMEVVPSYVVRSGCSTPHFVAGMAQFGYTTSLWRPADARTVIEKGLAVCACDVDAVDHQLPFLNPPLKVAYETLWSHYLHSPPS